MSNNSDDCQGYKEEPDDEYNLKVVDHVNQKEQLEMATDGVNSLIYHRDTSKMNVSIQESGHMNND